MGQVRRQVGRDGVLDEEAGEIAGGERCGGGAGTAEEVSIIGCALAPLMSNEDTAARPTRLGPRP